VKLPAVTVSARGAHRIGAFFMVSARTLAARQAVSEELLAITSNKSTNFSFRQLEDCKWSMG
jgi:hypothetical protein